MKQTRAPQAVPAFLILVVVSAFLLLTAPGAARAATGFDSTKATRPIAKPISVDPGLPDLYRKRLAVLTASHSGMDTPVRLVAGPPRKPGWMVLPRIADARGNAALERINRALAMADTEDADDDCLIERDVNTTLVGRRYLSLVVHAVSRCTGAMETDLSTEVLGFDLKTGAPVDWATMMPPAFQESDAEGELYRDTLSRDDPEDAKECAGFSFGTLDAWPDATDGGIAFQPAGGFPEVTEPCIITVVVPLAVMRKLGVNPALLDDIAQARAVRSR